MDPRSNAARDSLIVDDEDLDLVQLREQLLAGAVDQETARLSLTSLPSLRG